MAIIVVKTQLLELKPEALADLEANEREDALMCDCLHDQRPDEAYHAHSAVELLRIVYESINRLWGLRNALGSSDSLRELQCSLNCDCPPRPRDKRPAAAAHDAAAGAAARRKPLLESHFVLCKVFVVLNEPGAC